MGGWQAARRRSRPHAELPDRYAKAWHTATPLIAQNGGSVRVHQTRCALSTVSQSRASLPR